MDEEHLLHLNLPWSDNSDLPRSYRALTLGENGRVISTVPLSARCDRDAIRQASSLSMRGAVDLWDGLRFVEHFATLPRRAE